MNSIDQLLADIENGTIPLATLFEGADCNALLDARDDDETFERLWLDAYEAVKSTLSDPDPTLKLREQAFKAVSRATTQHEISSYVSDDFGLIAGCMLAGREDPYVAWLEACYRKGEFPRPPAPAF